MDLLFQAMSFLVNEKVMNDHFLVKEYYYFSSYFFYLESIFYSSTNVIFSKNIYQFNQRHFLF